MSDYIALTYLQAPDSLVFGYAPGDYVAAEVVQDWGLTDEQVEPAPGYQPARPADDNDDRDGWELYVMGQGTSEEDAKAASLDDLKAMYEAPPAPEPPAWQLNDQQATEAETATEAAELSGARPTDSAAKADWIAYVVGQGADETWANASSTTKDDLRNWQG